MQDLVSGAEVARQLGISRQRVAQLAADSKNGFPASIGRIGYANVYVLADVQAWAANRPVRQAKSASTAA